MKTTSKLLLAISVRALNRLLAWYMIQEIRFYFTQFKFKLKQKAMTT